MLKCLYEKNPKLITFGFILCIAVLVWGAVLIVDSIQKSKLKSTEYRVEFPHANGEVIEYNVDGLDEQQIEDLLKGDDN